MLSPGMAAKYNAQKASAPVATNAPIANQTATNVNAIDTNTEQNLTQAFARSRAGLTASQDAAKQNMDNDLTRQIAQTGGGGFGGAQSKIRLKAMADAARGFAGDQAAIDAQEAQAKAGLGEARAGRAIQIGGMGLSEKQLSQQAQQFADTMKYQWAEMNENQKTNLVNAWIAMKDAGILNGGNSSLVDFYNSGASQIYGNRLPANPRPDLTKKTNNPSGFVRA